MYGYQLVQASAEYLPADLIATARNNIPPAEFATKIRLDEAKTKPTGSAQIGGKSGLTS